MAQQTEAACLLESGATYRRRLLLRQERCEPIFAGFKAGAFSLYFGDAPIVHFDLEGRWQRAFVAGVHYLKGLDTAVQAIDRVREGKNLVLKRRTLPYDEAVDLDERIRNLVLGVESQLDAFGFDAQSPPAPAETIEFEDLHDMLRQADRDATCWFRQRERYLDTYGPLPVLPPDCPNPVILQTTRDGRLKSPDEFATHANDVARLIGRRVEQSKVAFLSGPDWLRRPAAEAQTYLDAVGETFVRDDAEGSHRLEGVHTYLDDLAPSLPDRDGWGSLRSLGLTRISLGVSPDRIWGEGLVGLVADLKAAGLGVGVILPGGDAADPAETAALVNRLDLGPGDLVSLLEADDLGGLAGAPDVDWGAASPDRESRLNDLKSRLAPVRTERKAKIAPFLPAKQGL